MVVLLGGCGGGDEAASETKTVTTPTYSFAAPADWRTRAEARTLTVADEQGSVLAVTTFRLARPFRPDRWDSAVAELDSVAAELADELGGRVASRATARVAGGRARLYSFVGAEDDTRRVAFVLRGRREFQLLCRWPDGADASACEAFLRSFRLV